MVEFCGACGDCGRELHFNSPRQINTHDKIAQSCWGSGGSCRQLKFLKLIQIKAEIAAHSRNGVWAQPANLGLEDPRTDEKKRVVRHRLE